MSSVQWALEEVQKQQQESLSSLDLLQRQHGQWQEAIKDLLTRLEGNPELCKACIPPGEGTRAEHDGDEQPSTLELVRRDTARSMQSLRQPLSGQMGKLLEEVWHDETVAPPKTTWEERQARIARMVESQAFEYSTGVLILVNIVLIGVEAEMSLQKLNTEWATEVERGFLTIYTVELILRLVAGGLSSFKNSWFLLDFFLVFVGLVALVVVPLMETMGSSQEGWENLLIVRGLRLLRLARILRTLKRFKVVWRLVSGLLSVWDTMASTTCLILLWLYIFGCIAVEVIASDEELIVLQEDIIKNHFSSLPRSTLTLLQFVTLDAIANVYFPLIMAKPVLLIYFLPLLMFLSIALMNLVTAVLVEKALEQTKQEAELAKVRKKQQIKATMPQLLQIFSGLDADGSGCLTREEVAGVPLDVLPPNVLEHVSV
ncbi:Muscle calcium channel subunit alpha-1 (MDL-alpha-1), partial [Durusdinium trenchii]